ncbi:hypothetical protein Ga0123461_1340 [Mariprofundus aestuarium]|uniref:Uncharacterized protein n=1 Tax=Mariprofundus aestuarium TaxID=1921086 RepID=A0A2K8L693_MARES|nr:hypothetical protein Ga0123461_1340 [Mariprofundus aestuarium]
MCYWHSDLREPDIEHMSVFLSCTLAVDVMRITNDMHCCYLVNKAYGKAN